MANDPLLAGFRGAHMGVANLEAGVPCGLAVDFRCFHLKTLFELNVFLMLRRHVFDVIRGLDN